MVTETELRDLYDLIRGERFAYLLLDATAALREEDFAAAHKLVQQVRESYGKSHARTLRKDPSQLDPKTDAREIARLNKKQQKYRHVLEQLDAAGAWLQKEAARRPKKVKPQIKAPPTHDTSGLPDGFVAAFKGAQTIDERNRLVREHFAIEEVRPGHMFRRLSLYYLRDRSRDYFLRITGTRAEDVLLQRAITGETLKSLPEAKLIELGEQGKLVGVTAKPRVEPPSQTTATAVPERGGSDPPDAAMMHAADQILDMGAFTQLLDSAQRSGLVPGADQIARARDREFRLGKYQEAFQLIEGMFGKFTAAALQRDQRLRREGVEIASGKLKLSPREMQAKRAKDNADTQKIERARSRFMRVLEGLRVLM